MYRKKLAIIAKNAYIGGIIIRKNKYLEKSPYLLMIYKVTMRNISVRMLYLFSDARAKHACTNRIALLPSNANKIISHLFC